ncbi:MAG: ribosome maturation factor RimP [Rhodospirillales bacterium]|nr:ribosome maturation factor RimP [Rhodospirillales bacterium]
MTATDVLTQRLGSAPSEAEARVESLIEPIAEELGYTLVRVRMMGGRHALLQIMAEPIGGGVMTVEGCVELSRAFSEVLDTADTIEGRYTLEVSSPGIDRPLTRRTDLNRFAGYEAKFELKTLHNGRRRFKGRLVGLVGDEIRLRAEDGEFVLPLAELAEAKLVATDELVHIPSKGKR